MKLISWNVNGIRACHKKGLGDFVSREKPDVFCVQETKAHREQVEPGALSCLPAHNYWSSAVKKGYSGVATFLKNEPVEVKHGIGVPEYDSEGRFVVTRHADFDLYNIYFPNGGSGEVRHLFKQKFLADLLVHFKNEIAAGRQLVVVGDYNVAHKHADVYAPEKLAGESGFLPEERAWFDSFLEAGFIDTFRHFHPDVKDRYTWWDQRRFARLSNSGWRIDYVCVTEGLKSRLVRADILDQVEGSDHCPVLIEMKD